MLWCVPAGLAAGFVLAFFGAGGAVIALPFLLFLGGLGPHTALGTNAAAVALIAAGLLTWRIRHQSIEISDGLIFAVAGIPGIFLGARLGLSFPGARLIFLLGFLLVGIAGWIGYLSALPEPGAAQNAGDSHLGSARKPSRRGRSARLAGIAFLVGLAAGFFAVAGGFLIVPAFIIIGGLEVSQAVSLSLIPMSAFSGLIAVEYMRTGALRVEGTALMVAGGLAGGLYGIWLSKRLSKTAMQRALALFLAALGIYIVLR